MCMYSQCDSTSLPVQRSQIKLFKCVLEQFKHAESKEIASAVLVLGRRLQLAPYLRLGHRVVYFDLGV